MRDAYARRILVEGVDLVGKTTLVTGLVEALQTRRVDARRNTGPLHPGLVARLATRRYRSGHDPRAPIQTWLFVGAAWHDVLCADRQGDGAILVQEAGIDHTIALAHALGRPIAAAAATAAAAWTPGFDATILVTCDAATRRARLAARQHADALDRLLIDDPAAAAHLERVLHARVAARPGLLVLDSAAAPPDVLVTHALAHIGKRADPRCTAQRWF